MAGKWLAGGWKYRLAITIDHTKFDSNLTWFPVMVRLSASCGTGAQDMTAVFDELGAESLKLAVTEDDGETQLYVEIEKWDEVGEEAILWVSLDGWEISSTSDTVIYLYYDSTHADNSTYVGVVGSAPGQAVWDANFMMVQHLNDDPDTSHVKDSTSNANNGTKDAANKPTETTGKVGEAQAFDGDDAIVMASSASLTITTGSFTFEALMNETSQTNVFGRLLIKRTGATNWYAVGIRNINTLNIELASAYPTFYTNVMSSATINGAWHLLTAIRNADDSKIYLGIDDNALESAADNTAGQTLTDAGDVSIGKWIGTATNSLDGSTVDELRFSNTVRSAAWLKATYNSLWDNLQTFTLENLVDAYWDFATWG
ncbi:MAG: hypothetical protein PHN78_05340 [Dehalococcoidales bacterium]|nr:hypothetical protein [Dehalococcoidales bacterium]